MFILLKVVVRFIVFHSSANLICRSTDISKCFIESLGARDNESRLYCVTLMYCSSTTETTHVFDVIFLFILFLYAPSNDVFR